MNNVVELVLPGGLTIKALVNSIKYGGEISERGLGVVEKLTWGVSGVVDIWTLNKIFESTVEYMNTGSDLAGSEIAFGGLMRGATYTINALFEKVVKDDRGLDSLTNYERN